LRSRHTALGARALAPPRPLVRVAAPAPPPVGEPRRLARPLAPGPRTSSYTGLVRNARSEGAGADHDEEIASPPGADAADFAALARGTAIGLALHEVLEHLDFTTATTESVERAVARASALHGVDPRSAGGLVRAVLDTLDTPLPPEGAFRLRDVGLAERVSELEFLLPVSDARPGAQRLTAERLGDAFAEHADRSELRAYAAALRGLDFAPLAGHLRGFVDLVVRHRDRWYLLDYKSNHLGGQPQDYAPERLLAPMREHHYVLQYHLYALALHRMLARRVPGYCYERDFGGVHYLFVRGLRPDRPLGWGVWFDRPPLALIDALGRALAPRNAA
jgi:exodeoxyribonuclease V beta subunit